MKHYDNSITLNHYFEEVFSINESNEASGPYLCSLCAWQCMPLAGQRNVIQHLRPYRNLDLNVKETPDSDYPDKFIHIAS